MVLTPPSYRPRYADIRLGKMMKAFGAVCVEGPKSCGKTWTALNNSESAIMISDPTDNFLNRKIVELDVNRSLNGDKPHLIDEWQEIPSIWDATRMEVDRTSEVGRFILTGSSTPVTKGVMHSGAGRIGKMRMGTMSLYESGDSDGSVPLDSLFDGSFVSNDTKKITLEHLIELIVRGGWPKNIGYDTETSIISNDGYLRTCIDDAASLDGRARDRSKIDMVIRSLARNESKTASLKKIRDDVTNGSVTDKAMNHYLDVLDRLFLTNNQPPFDPKYRSHVRVGSGVKRHLSDPSLAVSAMGLTPEKMMRDLNTTEFLFESLCERDLGIYAESIGGKLFHYRDSANREIDAVIELPDGRWGAFEIKLGTNQIDSASENLIRIRDYMKDRSDNPPVVLCIISGLSPIAYRRSDDVYVVPITALRGAGLNREIGRSDTSQ